MPKYVGVISPGYVKPLRDGKRVAIIQPGATREKLQELEGVVENLRENGADNTIVWIKPKDLQVTLVEVNRVEEIRGGELLERDLELFGAD